MNRHLLHDLPALGASVIQEWLKTKFGVRSLLMVVPHTFSRHLTFNAHLHILISAGGLKEFEGHWIADLPVNPKALMHMWRFAVITYLRAALKADVFKTEMSPAALKDLLVAQYERWWNIDVHRFTSKERFLRYAGRYARRPPIAQRRFVHITNNEVWFWTDDLREKRQIIDRHSTGNFVTLLAEHVPDGYQALNPLFWSIVAPIQAENVLRLVYAVEAKETPAAQAIGMARFHPKRLWPRSTSG